jgi:Domain of unknown function (DUF6895)
MEHYQYLLRHAHKWIETKQDNFNPLIWHEKRAAYTRRKAFSELAIYAYVLGADQGSNADTTLNHFVSEVANNQEYHRLLLRNPRQLLLYSAPLAYVIATKQATRLTLDCLDKVLSFSQVFGVERSAHRLMDLWQFLTLVDRRPGWLDARQVLAFSSLSHFPSAFDCTLSEAYAITHNAIFLKNFGVPDTRFDTELEYVVDRQTISLTLARFVSEGNSDIVLELLITLGLLGQLNGDDCRLILDWVAGRNRDQDYILGPSIDPTENIELSGLDQEWLANYHTTLVACSTLILTERNDWLLETASKPLFGTTIDDIIRWGEVISLINKYEIPKATAIIASIADWTEFGKFVVQQTVDYLRKITDEDTGHIGYWTDEIKAANTLDGQSQLDGELREYSNIAASILDTAHIRLSQFGSD